MTTIKEEWIRYARVMVPTDAGGTQVSETRRAFYAGFASALAGVAVIVGDDTLSDDECCERLAGWLELVTREFGLFHRDVTEGRR